MRRQTAGQQDFSIYDFSGGLNVKSAPQELADNELTQALNGYLRPDGGFESRRGINFYKSLNTGSTVTGLFRFYQQVKNGVSVNIVQTIGIAGTQVYNVDTGQVLGTVQAPFSQWDVAMASDPQATPLVGPGQPSPGQGLTTVMIICVGGTHGPYIYDGTRVYHPQGWDSVKGAQWCQVINGVCWFGGIPSTPNQVASTGTGIGVDVSFEKIAGYSVFDIGQPVVGLGVIGSGAQAMLAVGTPVGLTLIYGTGPANYTKQDVPMDNDGVSSGYSMVSNNGILYFLGSFNFYSATPSYPSAQIAPIGFKIQPWVTNDPFTSGYPMNGTRSNFFAFIYYDRYHLVYSSANGNFYDTVLTYDTNIQGWTVQQLGFPIFSACLINAPEDPEPSQVLVGGLGGRTYTWDAYVGATNSVWGQAKWNEALWDSTILISDDGTTIIPWVATKYFKVGEPGTVKCLHRIYPEILYAGSFNGTATVQTDYGLLSVFSAEAAAAATMGPLWDSALWDNALWSPSQLLRTSLNAPASRIDVTTQIQAYPYNLLTWNQGFWNQVNWGPLASAFTTTSGIQGEAFALGMQSGVTSVGPQWDASTSVWDTSDWGFTNQNQTPWVLSGWTGSFAQLGKP